MAGITQAQAHLDEWLAADLAVSKGQAYSIGGRSLSRADAAIFTRELELRDGQVKRLLRIGINGIRRHLSLMRIALK